MPCTEFCEWLANYDDLSQTEREHVDAHLKICLECRRWFEAFDQIDCALTESFGTVRAPANLASSIERQVAAVRPVRVSPIPEILDFVGWLGVICSIGLLLYFLTPPGYALSAPAIFAVFGILLAVALSATVWILRSKEA